jgi:Holliday junction resolvase
MEQYGNIARLSEFFETIEGSARIGNRTEDDQIQLCAPKLTDSSRGFYRATAELRGPNVKRLPSSVRMLSTAMQSVWVY